MAHSCDAEFLVLGSLDCALRVPHSLDGAFDRFVPEIQLFVRARPCRVDIDLSCFTRSFIPIVALALVFNMINVVGFTYAFVSRHIDSRQLTYRHLPCRDRDAKKKWASSMASSGWGLGIGGIGGQLISGVVRNSVGRVFGR